MNTPVAPRNASRRASLRVMLIAGVLRGYA